MKKCASCTKDLPDAALHCVFCGAKQPPAPAVQPAATAKTAFGYSAAEVQEQLRQQGAQPGRPPAPAAPPQGFAPAGPPQGFAPQRPAQPPSSQPMAMQATMLPPEPTTLPAQRSASPLAMAATQAVQAYPGPGPSSGGPGPSSGGPGPSSGGPGPGFGQPPGPGPSPSFRQPPAPPSFGQPPAPPSFGPPAGSGPSPAYAQGPGQPGFPPPGFPPAQPQPGFPPAQPQPGFPPAQPPPPGYVPASAASAKTMFVPGSPGPAPQGSFGPAAAMQATMVPAPLQPMPMPMPAPPQLQAPPMPPQLQAQPQAMPKPMPIPAAQPPPYHASQSLMQHRRPVDPWRDSLRAMMFIWGVLLLGAFATPLTTKPGLTFLWNQILDGAGTARLPPMVIAAVGLLSVLLAFIPMPTAARGVIATLLGLAGILVPILLVGVPPWQLLLIMAGTLLLIPGLILRSEYLASMLPRVLVTLGALAVLLPLLLPQNGALPLISVLKAVIDTPGSAKVGPALQLGLVVIVVMALLFTWMPAPVNGAAKLWAWLIILWSLVTHVATLLLAGHLGDAITGAPHTALVSWIYGGMGAAYLVIIGYGLASALGKQLE